MTGLHERIFLSALQKIFYSTPRLARTLISAAGSPAALFERDPREFKPLFGGMERIYERFCKRPNLEDVAGEISALANRGTRIVTLVDDDYPGLLKEIPDSPLALWVLGEAIELLNSPLFAVVGARKAIGYSRELAFYISRDVAQMGYPIVSGMAYGADAAAHLGALESSGQTIAVFGCGVDHIYPAEHAGLMKKILTGGLVISEFPPGVRPIPPHFPQRNRVISGISMAVLVVQAAQSSGSLITAKFALDFGREVLSVPGRGGEPSASGCNSLIRDGAVLVENSEDALKILEFEWKKYPFLKKSGHFAGDTYKGSPLLKIIVSKGTSGIDELIVESGMDATEVLKELSYLLINGAVDELPGKLYRLRSDR